LDVNVFAGRTIAALTSCHLLPSTLQLVYTVYVCGHFTRRILHVTAVWIERSTRRSLHVDSALA